MGLFGSFTGKDARRSLQIGRDSAAEELRKMNANADKFLSSGLKSANQQLQNQFNPSLGAINTNYNASANAVNAAATQAQRDINANTQAGLGYYQPYYNQGTRANALYGAAIGLNEGQPQGGGAGGGQSQSLAQLSMRYGLGFGITPGRAAEYNARLAAMPPERRAQYEAERAAILGQGQGQGGPAAPTRAQAQQIYMDDPMFAEIANRSDKALFNKYNAAGMADSGTSRLASQQNRYDQYGGWLDRLNQQGQQGFQAGNAMAGLQSQAGAQLANISMNQGNQLNSLYQNKGNALADLRMGYGQQRANNVFNTGMTRANNHINMGGKLADIITGSQSAIANTKGTLANNLLGLGGTILKAAAPGAGGVSALGNIASAF